MCTSTQFSGPASDQLGSCTVLTLVTVELGAQTSLELAAFPPSRGGRYCCTHAHSLPLATFLARHLISPLFLASPELQQGAKAPDTATCMTQSTAPPAGLRPAEWELLI